VEISNSLWVVDKAGKLGLVDSISGSDALVRYHSKTEPHFGELTRVALTSLKQATAAQLPEGHGMAPAELDALGYTSAPSAAPARPEAA